tara:strand:+ start:3635 stop:3778 length:144 start_codon:yes stop_codon:yes gene_type:complete
MDIKNRNTINIYFLYLSNVSVYLRKFKFIINDKKSNDAATFKIQVIM